MILDFQQQHWKLEDKKAVWRKVSSNQEFYTQPNKQSRE